MRIEVALKICYTKQKKKRGAIKLKNIILELVLGVIAGFGGITGIIILGIKISANTIIDRIEKRFQYSLDKEMEKYKTVLGNKTYISKTKFDTEFNLYRELSKSFFELTKNISILIPAGVSYQLADKEKQRELENEHYKIAHKSTVEAQDILNSNIPFMPENIYDGYSNILSLCKQQLNVFEQRWNVLYLATQEEKEKFSTEDYNRTNTINKNFREVNNTVREYLASLDVI